MGSITDDSPRAVTKIFNSAIAAPAIAAAWEIGFLDALKTQKHISIPKFAAEHGLDHDATLGLAFTLALVGVIQRDRDAAAPGRLFDETLKRASMFHWLTLGSGSMFSRMQHALRTEERVGDYYQRDAAAIALDCRDMNHRFFDPVFHAALAGLGSPVHTAVDLGCGSGERLMQILDRCPGSQAVGIDIAGSAIDFARAEARARGFGDRLSFVVGDARDLAYRPEFAEVDLLTCFMMGHDFWPRANCVASLRKLRRAFPKVRRFLLGDSTRAILESAGSKPPVTGVTEDNITIFTLGFEFGHLLMDTYIPTMQEWYDVFAECGWRCIKGHELPESANAVVFELEPLD